VRASPFRWPLLTRGFPMVREHAVLDTVFGLVGDGIEMVWRASLEIFKAS
jgi:hypothetical protein